MANPTTYFGWVMPTSASLVTNLPADFNTFGQGVDTSLQDLLGGTTGQVLSKASGTNMDFTWVTPTDQTPLTTKGDLFAFSTVDARLPAGANETRLVADSAQTLGLKYVADTTNYAIAAKADLLVGTAADTLAALTVGTNGQVLTADSTVSPTGLKWATPATSTPTFVGCQLYKTATQSIAHSTSVFMTWENEYLDTDSFHSTVTNTSRITIPSGKAGVYLVFANIEWASNATGQRSVHIWKNGAALFSSDIAVENNPNTTGPQAQNLVLFANCSVGDYLETRVTQNSGGNLNTSAEYCGFGAYLIGA
jgi:hypothetical protein